MLLQAWASVCCCCCFYWLILRKE